MAMIENKKECFMITGRKKYKMMINGKEKTVRINRELDTHDNLVLQAVTPFTGRILATLTLSHPRRYDMLTSAYVHPNAVTFIETNHLGQRKTNGQIPVYQFDYAVLDR